MTTKEVVFSKDLSKEELNRRRRIYMKAWREQHPWWNNKHSRNYYYRKQGRVPPVNDNHDFENEIHAVKK